MNPKCVEILLAEDNPGDVRLTREALRAARFINNLHVVSDGVQALAFLRREGKYANAPRPDVILLDLNMPRKDGREVLAELKSDTDLRTIPVVVLTTSRADEDIASSYALRANCYVTKPLDLRQFMDAVKHIHSFWLTIVKLPPKGATEVPPVQALMIEDNVGDARLIEEMLFEERAMPVTLAREPDLARGIEHLRSRSVDVILLDLTLPDSHGLETYAQLREYVPDTPVIILSGLDDESAALKAVQMGAQDYIMKQKLENGLLMNAIRYGIERQRLLADLDSNRRAQLETKDQFLTHVSHELRTPLNALYQFVSLVHEGLAGDLNAEQQEYLDIAMRNVDHLKSMITDLTEVARAQSHKLRIDSQCVQISEVIRETLETVRSSVGNDVPLHREFRGKLPLVWADPQRLRQIVINLVTNAVKHGAKDQPVIVRAWVDSEDPRMVRVSVADRGPGIRPDIAHRIFERLYQDESTEAGSRRGLGLGLYICKELVALMGGRIGVESAPGQGSTFHFTIPVFSMDELLRSVVFRNGALQTPLTLITLESKAAEDGTSVTLREEMHEELRHIVERSIISAQDVLLPDFFGAGSRGAAVVLASADETGAGAMGRRIQNNVREHPEFHDSGLQVAYRVHPLPVDAWAKANSEQHVLKELTAKIEAVMHGASQHEECRNA